MNIIPKRVEPERLLFDTILEFTLDNNLKKDTKKLLKNVKRLLTKNKDLDLEKRFPITMPDQRFTLIDLNEIFVQDENQLDTNNISVLDMMPVDGSVWSFDWHEHKKHFFELLKLLFEHGARSIYHIQSGKRIPYLIFMTLNNKHALEIFLRYADDQRKKYESFFRFIFNNAYNGQDTLVSPVENDDFVLKKGYTVLHTLIECNYDTYYDTMKRITESRYIKLDFEYNKNNPFYLALETYNSGNENFQDISNVDLIIPYFNILSIKNSYLTVNQYDRFGDENLTTFMMLLRSYHFEPNIRLKDQLFNYIDVIIEAFSPQRLKTRKEEFNPLLYFLTIQSTLTDPFSELYLFTQSNRKNDYDPNNEVLSNIKFRGTVKMFELLTKGRKQVMNLTEFSKQYLSPLLYILSLNLDYNGNHDYNQLIDVFRNSFTRFGKAYITQHFVSYYIMVKRHLLHQVSVTLDGIHVYHAQIVKNMLAFKLFQFRIFEIRLDPTDNQDRIEDNKSNLHVINELIILEGIQIQEVMGIKEIVFILNNLRINEYLLIFNSIKKYNGIDKDLIVKDQGIEEMPLRSYIEYLIHKPENRDLYHELNEFLETIFDKESSFEEYLRIYHQEYLSIKKILAKNLKKIFNKDTNMFIEYFMTQNGIEPEYIADIEDEQEFPYMLSQKPRYPYYIIYHIWQNYRDLWWDDKIPIDKRKKIFDELKQLSQPQPEEGIYYKEPEYFQRQEEQMTRRFEDL